MIYALWGAYVYFNYRHISATQSPDVPDDGGMMYLFVMLVVTVAALVALLIAAAVLCAFRRARAVGVGMMVTVLLPLVLLAAHYLWASMQIADAVGAGA
ncbi:hypothetical protein [Plantactinospora mayteni]|nr:hypothetical protein [Plantactinospora mayteni]